MVDLIKPLKIEDEDLGNITETDPNEDFVTAKGFSLGNSQNHLIEKVDDQFSFSDPINGTIKMSDLGLNSDIIDVANSIEGLGVYDETNSYESGDVVLWSSVIWQANSSRPALSKGDLSDVPGVSTNWNSLIDENLVKLVEKNTLNLLINSLMLAALSDDNIQSESCLFVDTFTDNLLLDSNSINYTIDVLNGSVALKAGGDLIYLDSTKADFDLGVFTNTESFLNLTGDGAVRKKLTTAGGLTVIEDFEDVTNVNYSVRQNVFSDNFEDGDISNWYLTDGSEGTPTGVVTTGGILGNASTGLETDDVIGNYGLRVQASDRAYSPIVNCSGLSNVQLKFYIATYFLTPPDQEIIIGWFDGSDWQEVHAAESGDSGYVIIDIPDNYLSSTNQIVIDVTSNSTLFGGINYYNFGIIDDIEIYYGEDISLSQSSLGSFVYSGSYSGKFLVDFKTAVGDRFTIDLDPSVDISSENILRFYILKPDFGVYQYKIYLIDGRTGASWDTGALNFPDLHNWYAYEILISTISGIDLTDLAEIRVQFIDDTSNAEVFNDLYEPTVGDSIGIGSGDEIEQTFQVSEDVTVGRIKMNLSRNDNAPRTPLYIGIANPFGTTYAVAQFIGDQVPSSSEFTEVVAEFDTNITLKAGMNYSLILLSSEGTWAYKYKIPETSSTVYNNGVYYINGTAQSNFLNFALLSPSVDEYIYVDQIESEGASVYETSGNYESVSINLGLIPDSLDDLLWTVSGDEDDVELRVRFASTQTLLDSATWSSWYTNPEGGFDLSSLTPSKWFQYEFRFINGTSAGTSIVEGVTLMYSVSAGTGNAIVISKAENLATVPSKFIMIWDAFEGTGLITYFVSRDDGVTWQAVSESDKGVFTDFTVGSGTFLKMKAVITGNAKLYGWGILTDSEL